MGQKKLIRFEELKTFTQVLQYPENMAGHWADHFGNTKPITLELACGKGEYAIGLARLHSERNFIGIDLKGNRLWVGAKITERNQLRNVAFLRTQIDRIAEYFQPGEVKEIWITFPDPQLRWSKLKKRLTHPKFLRLYQQVLKPGGKIHLKTDSPDLYSFTKQVVELYKLIVHADTADLYHSNILNPELQIKTHYESLDIAGSSRIHYLCFSLPEELGNQALDSLLKEKCRPDGAVD